MQGTVVTAVFAFLLFLTEVSPWNLRPFEGRGSMSKPSPRGSFLSYPDTHTLPRRLTCCSLSLAHKPWLSSGDLLFVHLLPLSWTLLLAHHLLLPSSHHLFLLGFTFSSSLCPISVSSSPAFQPGQAPSPYSESTQAELISSVPECPIIFSTLISPFLCPQAVQDPQLSTATFQRGNKAAAPS